MAWTDQCKIAFQYNCKALFLKQKGRKNLTKILKQLQKESGIPWKTLYHWWNDLENLKNQKNAQATENTEKVEKADDVQLIEIPLCIKCGKSPVFLTLRGKPLSKASKHYGLCNGCRAKRIRIESIDKDVENGDGIQCYCPKCNHAFYINRMRTK